MQRVNEQFEVLFAGYLPTLVGGLLILILGWLIASLLSSATRGLLRRTTVDNRLTQWVFGPETTQKIEIEKWIAMGVFYIVMLFALVGFFDTINLDNVSAPLNNLLDQILSFGPRLLSAVVLGGVAWLIATFLRLLVTRATRMLNLDQRVSSEMNRPEDNVLPVARVIGDGVYWLTFLLFLPAILQALSLESLLFPVQSVLNQMMAYLPNLFAAALIFVVGWFIARILQRITVSFLAAFGIDQFAASIGLNQVLGTAGLSRLVGYVVYILVFVPILISGLDALEIDSITTPATNMLNSLMVALPLIFGAMVVLFVSYLIARIAAGITTNFLRNIGFDSLFQWFGLTYEPGERRTPSDLAGNVVLVATMLFALIEAFQLLGFETLAILVAQFVTFSGQVLLSAIVFAIGLYLANLASQAIQQSRAPEARLLAMLARTSILVLAGAMALRQMGVADDIINLAFGLILGAIALAVGLAFGLGGRDVAGRELDEVVRSLKSRTNPQNQ